MAESDVQVASDLARDQMGKAIESLRIDLKKVRTGRANTALLESVQVDYYGTATPLNQIANLTTPDPRLIVVSPYDKGALREIERAIQASDLGFTPANDGKLIRVPIPPLTEERRKELVKHVRKIAEDHKLGVREARRECVSTLKSLVSDGALPEDERHRAERKVQEMTDKHVKKIDELAEQKQQEILQV
jgi:ribosome recycling factor